MNRVRYADSIELSDSRLYKEIVGSLIYVMTGTRPDLCCIDSVLSQHQAKPTNAHLQLVFLCDYDWGASEDRRSIAGYGFQLCKNGPLISWKSRKQQTVALSTCEAEYMAQSAATQEAKFLRQQICQTMNKIWSEVKRIIGCKTTVTASLDG